MKKMILIVTGFAVLVTGAYFSTFVFAQGTQPAQVQGTKVAVVNIGLVFNKYERAKAFKRELEATLEQPRKEAKKLMEEMDGWAEKIRKNPTMAKVERDSLEDAIYKHKQRLDTMNRDITKLLGKKSEDNLVVLWKEVNDCIEAVSKAYGFQVVMGYGDPMEKNDLNLFPNVNRKMQAMDAGSTVPLYVHGSVDLSSAVADTLNHWLQEAQKKQGLVPAGK